MSIQSSEVIRQPVFFIPHGAGPCFFMDWNPADTWHGMAEFLQGIASRLPAKPKAILMVSAHWRTSQFSVTSGREPTLIYDYFGFPEHTYALTYPAPGSPELAKRVMNLVNGIDQPVTQNPTRGFDHGMFIPLKLMFPAADIPVVQLSLRQDLDPRAHLQVGQALAALRDEGVLIVGSGMSFHNMRGYGDKRFTPRSEAFDEWLTAAVEGSPEQRYQQLKEWHQAPHAFDCHPLGHEEHLLPLMVVAGAAGNDAGQKVYSERVLETQLSAFQFG
ncbi:Aromatic ring-opening dioxygenase, catalytic subunit, LigB family [Pseudidiomarina indica]|uniref:Aromatic ring-opening dioxygenase, catalytic subunit, LigB family n=2 Tax=Pseudidiomarina indica TaxID=1159017 RepID=A0A1G6BVR0_9GAMM|nr:Aromatic ring-opening dioxygenase, catalytic subunit, LigB family [Pseudidiomarina indica]